MAKNSSYRRVSVALQMMAIGAFILSHFLFTGRINDNT
jgi:hypothetical protein